MFKVERKALEQGVKSVYKFIIKAPKRHSFCRSGVFNVNFEHILHLVLAFYFKSEQVNTDRHMLYSLSHIQKQSPRGVFQERCSTNI